MTSPSLLRVVSLLALSSALLGTPALAQQPAKQAQPAKAEVKKTDAKTTTPPNTPAVKQPAKAETKKATSRRDLITITVEVKRAGKPVPRAPVFLFAARKKGPFEPTDPKPAREWVGMTDAKGLAVFTDVPRALTTSNLRLHAVASHRGTTYKSGQSIPVDGLTVKVPVYEMGAKIEDVRVEHVRMEVVPWEDSMVFRQFWSITVAGDRALDTSKLPGEQYEKGLPLLLPKRAKGISKQGPGKLEVVENRVFWRGLIKPGERVNLAVGFTMTAKSDELVFRQQTEYPIKEYAIMIPLAVRESKLKRLDRLAVRAIDFPDQRAGRGLEGVNPNIEMLLLRREQVKPGSEIKFKLEGLPFERPVGPLVALALGLLVALGAGVLARREQQLRASSKASASVREVLGRERDELFAELDALERDLDEGFVSDREYEVERALLRARAALVVARLRDLDGEQPEQGAGDEANHAG